MDVLLDHFAKVVFESSYTATRGQSGISLPGGMVMSFALPFDLLKVRFEPLRWDRTIGKVTLTKYSKSSLPGSVTSLPVGQLVFDPSITLSYH